MKTSKLYTATCSLLHVDIVDAMSLALHHAIRPPRLLTLGTLTQTLPFGGGSGTLSLTFTLGLVEDFSSACKKRHHVLGWEQGDREDEGESGEQGAGSMGTEGRRERAESREQGDRRGQGGTRGAGSKLKNR